MQAGCPSRSKITSGWFIPLLALVSCSEDSLKKSTPSAATSPATREVPAQWTSQATRAGQVALSDIPFNGQRAYEYLRQLCAIGPRVSGTAGMARQQELLERHFKELGGLVTRQRFRLSKHPLSGNPVQLSNLIVEWHPQRKERVLLCAHYDTRPLPDQDPDPLKRRRGTFLGANDGGSGVALLMELGHQMPQFESPLGVDFVFFDAEEFVFDERRDKYFLGSEHFARQYRRADRRHTYRWGILLDMVGDARLSIFQEHFSATWPDTRPLVQSIWETARRLGVQEFLPTVGYRVNDDHVPLHNIGKIPICDIIDFAYPDRSNRFWHTEEDVPRNCSALSLAKVGWVLQTWLETADQLKPVSNRGGR